MTDITGHNKIRLILALQDILKLQFSQNMASMKEVRSARPSISHAKGKTFL